MGVVNEGFVNSHVKIRVHLHCAERYVGHEIHFNDDMYAAFADYKDTRFKLKGSADLVVLLMEDSDVGGTASVGRADGIALVKKGFETAYVVIYCIRRHNSPDQTVIL